MLSMFFKGLSAFALFGILTSASHAQAPGENLVTARAETSIVSVPSAEVTPRMTAEAFGILIACQSGYQGGLDDAAIERCVAGQRKSAAE